MHKFRIDDKDVYFKICISIMTDKGLTKISITNEKTKKNTYIIEKLPKRIRIIENNMIQAKAIKDRMKIVRLKNARD